MFNFFYFRYAQNPSQKKSFFSHMTYSAGQLTKIRFFSYRVCKTCGFRIESGLRPPVHRVCVGLDFTTLPCAHMVCTVVAVSNEYYYICCFRTFLENTVCPTLDRIRVGSSLIINFLRHTWTRFIEMR